MVSLFTSILLLNNNLLYCNLSLFSIMKNSLESIYHLWYWRHLSQSAWWDELSKKPYHVQASCCMHQSTRMSTLCCPMSMSLAYNFITIQHTSDILQPFSIKHLQWAAYSLPDREMSWWQLCHHWWHYWWQSWHHDNSWVFAGAMWLMLYLTHAVTWKRRVVMMPTLLSKVSLEVVSMTNLGCHQWKQSWHHDNSPFSLLPLSVSYCDICITLYTTLN